MKKLLFSIPPREKAYFHAKKNLSVTSLTSSCIVMYMYVGMAGIVDDVSFTRNRMVNKRTMLHYTLQKED